MTSSTARDTPPPPVIDIKRLPHAQGLDLPAYATSEAAGMDLRAALAPDENLELAPGQRALVPTGLTMALPRGYEAQVRPRSGLAAKDGVSILNTPGTIDSDYRGEVRIILINLGDQPFTVTRNMRIAQMVIAPVVQALLRETRELPDTQRGTDGFGSTGTDAGSL